MAVPTSYAKIANSATPFSVMIQVTGGTGSALIPSATLLGYLAAGPLKAYLQSVPVAAWDQLNFDTNYTKGDKIRIYDSALSNGDVAECRSTISTIWWVANSNPALAGLGVDLNNNLEGPVATRTIEIRYLHSTPV